MTIHHDKLAYGKLASAREDVPESLIDEMNERLKKLAGEEKAEEERKKQEKNAEE